MTKGGEVRRIVVGGGGSQIMWAADESLPDTPGIPVGIVYLLDPASFAVLPVKVRTR